MPAPDMRAFEIHLKAEPKAVSEIIWAETFLGLSAGRKSAEGMTVTRHSEVAGAYVTRFPDEAEKIRDVPLRELGSTRRTFGCVPPVLRVPRGGSPGGTP